MVVKTSPRSSGGLIPDDIRQEECQKCHEKLLHIDRDIHDSVYSECLKCGYVNIFVDNSNKPTESTYYKNLSITQQEQYRSQW